MLLSSRLRNYRLLRLSRQAGWLKCMKDSGRWKRFPFLGGMLVGMRIYMWVFDVSNGWCLSGWKRARGDGDDLRLGTLEDGLATVWKKERVGHTRF